MIFLDKKPKLRILLFVDANRGGKSQRDEKNDYENGLMWREKSSIEQIFVGFQTYSVRDHRATPSKGVSPTRKTSNSNSTTRPPREVTW